MQHIHLKFDTLINPEKVISDIEDKMNNSEFSDLIFKAIKYNSIVSSTIFQRLASQDKSVLEADVPTTLLTSALESRLKEEATDEEVKKLIDIISEDYSEFIPREMATWQESIKHYKDEAIEYLCKNYSDDIKDCLESTEPIPK